MVTYSSILAWRILWTEEPGRKQFIGLTNIRSKEDNPCLLVGDILISNKTSDKALGQC